MEIDLLAVALQAGAEIFTPMRMGFLFLGVIIGLIIGVIPGLGGLVGMALLLPFTFDMDITTALAFLVGLSAVTVTSDTIPAVLFGVPGTVGSAATVLDGYPLARQGKAAQAFGAAFSASVIGGLFGAALLGVSVPILRPFMLEMATPELLAVVIVGLSLVSVLSGASPTKGLIACCLGLWLPGIGDDIQTATLRWTFDTIYLYDGLPLVPVALGIFAIPEILDLVIARKRISGEYEKPKPFAQLEGVKATLRHWFLVLRCASIGSTLGVMPGIGSSIIDWIAYAHAKATLRGADKSFGTGDIRGVIASESANNAKEGGALVPTIAFGIPGSAAMAILLGAFIIQGINPGPQMLGERLDVTYSLVWSVAIANIIGAGLCFAFAGWLARIALIPIHILAPIVLAFVFVGAYQGSSDWGDIVSLFVFGALGFTMKRLGWARPPLILGLVLGELLERYTFITVSRYDVLTWTARPVVMTLLILAVLIIMKPILTALYRRFVGRSVVLPRERIVFKPHWPRLEVETVFLAGLIALFVMVLVTASEWKFGARLFPQSIATAGLIFIAIHLAARYLFSHASATASGLDLAGEDYSDIGRDTVVRRLVVFVALCAFFVVAANLVGFIFAMGFFVFAFVRSGGESWAKSAAIGVAVLVFSYLLFQVGLRLTWPGSLIGDIFPETARVRWTDIF